MVYIKKLVMQGFKSFVRKTEIPFTPGINVILGPNGSGKSNVSDALCFVLGRLSAKSMRAARAKNLIFSGTKVLGPAKEAIVEVVFDNSDKLFSIDQPEISIKRILRKNGLSIYKINNETKTRQDVLQLLAQAGIDPNGFNIILQGEIQNLVRMRTEDRRKIIEEVSGISIYESRKEKSLRELEKTESRLTEVVSILRERTSYLNNLEKERQQALKFKQLEKDIQKYKASILYHDLSRKKKEIERVNSEISQRDKEIEKNRNVVTNIRTSIENFESKIKSLNSTMQKSTGLEQEKLNHEIANIRAELMGLNVNLEHAEKKISEIQKQKQELKELINNNELSVNDLKKESSKSLTETKKQKEIEEKKKELEELEEQRKKFYTVKSELKSIKERIQDKKNLLQIYSNESTFLIKQIEALSTELFDNKTDSDKLDSLKVALAQKKDFLNDLNQKEIDLDKVSNINEYEIDKLNKLMEKISRLDICPLCKSKITEEHMKSIGSETSPKIKELQKEIDESDKQLNDIYNKKELLRKDIEQITSEISKREYDLIKLSGINEKTSQVKVLKEKIDRVKQEISGLEDSRKRLEKNFDENSTIEQKYETVRIEVQEISMRSKENVDSEISFKQRELERAKVSLKQLSREDEDLSEEILEIKKDIKEKEESLERKKEQEEQLTKKFKQLISERDGLQTKIREVEYELSNKQNNIRNFEQQINELKIEKAKVSAEAENLETEMLAFPNIEVIKTNRDVLTQKLSKAQEFMSGIGSVNLRSLEVYDEIKKEYDLVKEKTETISKEKEGILKIIHEIDIKKKKAFLQTLGALNEIFSKNFSQLSTKGQVSLELENKKDPFIEGVGILVKTGHGKYFDVTSLSGGEQALVALSLIFAIQELNPYCFYVLDEIDAALDKRNSERLAGLLRKYMQKGQYVVITHNDEVITNATNLYGISMHDGISKIISLKV